MRRNLPYNLIADLEMVWIENTLLVAGTMRWLNWFYLTERPLEFMNPTNNTGMSCAMQVRVDWIHGAAGGANFTNDVDEYLDSGTATSKQALDAIDAEQARVYTNSGAHNAEQKKSSWEDVVREKLFNDSRQTFKGTGVV